MATAEFIGCAPARARKKSPRPMTPRRRLLSRLGLTLAAGRRLRAELPSDDPAVRAVIADWLAHGEAVAVIITARV